MLKSPTKTKNISFAQRVKELIEQVVYTSRIEWSIGIKADPFLLELVNSEHTQSKLFGFLYVSLLQIKPCLTKSIKPRP